VAIDLRLEKSRRLIDRVEQAYLSLVGGRGTMASLATIPAERLAYLRGQFESAKEAIAELLTIPAPGGK
jgi:hypothetical protein